MIRRFSAFAPAFLLLVFLSGCALFRPAQEWKNCRFTVHSLAFSGLDAAETHWKLSGAVVNPNAYAVTLMRMQFALMHENDTLFSGWNPERRELAAQDSQAIEIKLDLPNNILKRLPPGMLANPDARFRLLADAYVNTWMGEVRVPNAIGHTVHIDMPDMLQKYGQQLFRRFLGQPQ